jgi:hypothetical protein
MQGFLNSILEIRILAMRSLGVFAAVFLVACQAATSDITSTEAIDISNNYMSHTFHQVSLSTHQVSVVDHGPTWRVRYQAPPTSAGGRLDLEINKRTGDIVSVLGEQ